MFKLTNNLAEARLLVLRELIFLEIEKEEICAKIVIMIRINFVVRADGGPDPARFSDIETTFASILGMIVPFMGLTVFIMILIGGFNYMTAGGDPGKAEAARKTITWAIIGLVTVLCIWFVMRLIEAFTGVNVTQFVIPK